MDVSGQLHAPATLPTGKELVVSIHEIVLGKNMDKFTF